MRRQSLHACYSWHRAAADSYWSLEKITGVASITWAKNCLDFPLSKNSPLSRWRRIRLAIKPRYLGNHASQINSYYGSLSGSHGRSFRIRHEKSFEAPPGGEKTMTSYTVCNTTSLPRKPCIAVEKLLLKTFMKSWSLSTFNEKQQILIFKT